MLKLFEPKFTDIVEKYSDETGLSRSFVYAVIRAESNFSADAVSHADAYGLMQITEDTFDWIAMKYRISDKTAEDLFDPDFNIYCGTLLLKRHLDKFGGVTEALCAYNAGSARTEAWLANKAYSEDGIVLSKIPFSETKKYVRRIEIYQRIYEFLGY